METERAQADAELNRVRTDRTRLDRQLAAAKAKNDSSSAKLLALQRGAKDAQVKVNTANISRIEAAKASSQMAKKIKELEARIVTAQESDKTKDVIKLNRELAVARQESQSLSVALTENQAALVKAQDTVKTSQAEVTRLRSAIAKAKTKVAAPVAPVAPVAPATPPTVPTPGTATTKPASKPAIVSRVLPPPPPAVASAQASPLATSPALSH